VRENYPAAGSGDRKEDYRTKENKEEKVISTKNQKTRWMKPSSDKKFPKGIWKKAGKRVKGA